MPMMIPSCFSSVTRLQTVANDRNANSRIAQGLTQQQIRKETRDHRVTRPRWENGAAKPHRLYLVELIKLNAG